jgi:hypothetical protein
MPGVWRDRREARSGMNPFFLYMLHVLFVCLCCCVVVGVSALIDWRRRSS